MRNDVIINATGSDNITLWKLNGRNIRFSRERNPTWIFVSGDRYDLDRLSVQLDRTEYRYEFDTSRDIFGPVNGRPWKEIQDLQRRHKRPPEIYG
ncbi:hypothetical protein ApAK_08420 [Thermoplasmatales archaeon AK]|nr:hypothetical protein [Thermoplasmatales archaeon AK]